MPGSWRVRASTCCWSRGARIDCGIFAPSWVNGVATVDYTEADASIAKSGVIGVQIHGGPACEASYRNIRIKQLK